jgi:carboxylesterase
VISPLCHPDRPRMIAGMNDLQGVPPETKVTPGARTLRLYHAEAPTAALVLHGYTGFVEEMRYLAETLHGGGMSVLVPRLPGHGTNSHDFRASGARDWWRAAIDGYLELADGHSRIVVAGLSMGGVLAALLAGHFPVARLALLAPALDVTNRLVPLTPLLRYFVGPRAIADPERYDDPEREYLAQQYWNYRWPRETAELYYLIRRARRVLPRVTCPTLTVVSEKDESVPVRVLERINRTIGASEKDSLVVSESNHLVCNDADREQVARGVLDWFLR